MAAIPVAGWTPARSTAIHEAAHAVAAYLLSRPFTSISVIDDGESYGRVHSQPPGEWFRPDIEINARTRATIEDRVMISLAGAETEATWCARQSDAPENWRDLVNDGAAHDFGAAFDLASHVADGSVPETEAYIEWLRQRVLNWTGRGPDFDVTAFTPDAPALVVSHYRNGSSRYWTLVGALADAVARAGQLRWREARTVLRDADPLFAAIKKFPPAPESTP
jgi:hypothetical protein